MAPHLRMILVFVATGMLAGAAKAQTGPLQRERPATESTSGLALPKPDPVFRGKIGETVKDSTPDYPAPLKAPKGAPNVLIILLDDVGFGQASTFGGPVPTPTLERLAQGGLRYNTFHTTALCSPTRAALLTGRNHHSAGSGVIIETGTGYPGYTGIIPQSTAMVPEILRGNGYATAMFGKWHNTPEAEISPAGPFNHWPTGFGFDYFYGFNQGETSQWYPVLYRNTTAVAQPKSPEQGYHFTADMTDEAINWLGSIRAVKKDQPWFMYYAAAAAHAPHHAPKAWRDKFRGKFDQGWDKQREITFAEQKRLGVIPQDARLTPRPKEIPAWDDQSDAAKRVYARLMENYAAYLAYADNEIGRLVDSVAQAGELDNTLIFYIVGDNGASAEGGLEGSFNDIASLLGYNPGLDVLNKRLDQIGGPESEPQVPVGWAWAMDTPFQWTKQVASHFGGTRNPLVVHWPNGIKAHGELRTQFHHVIDIVPTILEATHVPAPKTVNGIPQKPMEGVSMAYSFDEAKARSRRTTQYFEMFVNRAIYHDGWVAASRFGVPWNLVGRVGTFLDAPWELYHVDADFSEADDLAATNPQKLRQLQALFMEEAKKHDVLPLDSRFSERGDPRNRIAGELPTRWTYHGNNVRMPEPSGPRVFPNSHVITATLTIPPAGAEGVITATGGRSGGWSLYVLDGKLTYHYNSADFEHSTIRARAPLPGGKVAVKLEYVSNGPKRGGALNNGATVKLSVNGELVGEGGVGTGMRRHGAEPFEVGRDSISPVSPDYKSKGAFPFTGTIDEITFAAAPVAK
ncbi:arylsulfatase [Cupriavidus necator]|uniref:Arylsulfatase n=1 Tax=Cupriavidus necator TaxID=106590 RepID=A0A367PJ19_CUPNE|nr:arylsulfatase [Cupriavidus necator]QQX82849.1 arylsulfatase [Cupriavidus necator]RCJ07543.1 arylsulfatase [Cupriavidus necator]